MFACIKRWYQGTTELHTFDEINNDPRSGVFVMPQAFTTYHWTARIARAIVAFYMKHWQWIWTTIIASATLAATIYAIR